MWEEGEKSSSKTYRLLLLLDNHANKNMSRNNG